LLTLERLATTTQIPLDRVLANLDAAGVRGAEPRVTVAALASANDLLALDDGLARLRARGIEASADSPMKDVAERHGKRPHDVVEILAGA